MKFIPEWAYRLALAEAPYLKPEQYLRLRSQFLDLSLLFSSPKILKEIFQRQKLEAFSSEVFHCAPSTLAYFLKVIDKIDALVDVTSKWLELPFHHLLFFDDEAYPAQLKNISHPPLILYVKGRVEALSEFQLAMVGSRKPTREGLRIAESWSALFVESGVTITSGLAYGIDAASHRGALSLKGPKKGSTIGVLGSGLQSIYPRIHTTLVDDIVANEGAVISEFSLNTAPCPMNFPRRNRIISGLSAGVLVVEAALKSGSLITARLAAEQGREVMAVPGSVDQLFSQGCHALIREGAQLVQNPTEVLMTWPERFFQPTIRTVAPNLSHDVLLSLTPRQDFSDCEQRLWSCFSDSQSIISMDQFILVTGLTTATICSILCSFEMEGLVESTSGGYRRC